MADGAPIDPKLKEVLQKSFTNIRHDMDDLRTAQAFILQAQHDLMRAFERMKGDAPANEELKAIQKQLSDLALHAKKMSELCSQVDGMSPSIKAASRAASRIDAFEKDVSSIGARIDSSLVKTEFDSFVRELNSEIKSLRDHIHDVEGSGGRVVDFRFQKLQSSLDDERRMLSRELEQVRKKADSFVQVGAMERVLREINGEFDTLKKENKELREELSCIRHQVVAATSVRRSVLDRIASHAEEKAEAKADAKVEAKAEAKTDLRAGRKSKGTIFDDDDLEVEIVKVSDREESFSKGGKTFLRVANGFIVLAFLSLAGSIALTFLRKTPWDAYLLWGGGIGFMALGTLLRIIAILKNKE